MQKNRPAIDKNLLCLSLGIDPRPNFPINKPHADWTYLIMKVRKSARTNGQTKEKVISLMFLCEKKTTKYMWKKSKENLQKRRFPAYFRHFRPE